MFQQHCCCLLQVQNNPIIESTYNDSLQVPDKLLAVATMHYVWRLCHGLVPGFAASMCDASFALSECHFTSLLMILVAYQWIRCPVIITYSATAEVSAAAEHVIITGHRMNWDETRITDRVVKRHSRKVRRALHIDAAKLALNYNRSVELTPWLRLLHKENRLSGTCSESSVLLILVLFWIWRRQQQCCWNVFLYYFVKRRFIRREFLFCQ